MKSSSEARFSKARRRASGMVTEDDGSEHDYQFEFTDSGRYDFSERDILERDFGEEWVDEMDAAIGKTITDFLSKKNAS